MIVQLATDLLRSLRIVHTTIEEILIANKGTIPELSFGLRLAGAKIGVA